MFSVLESTPLSRKSKSNYRIMAKGSIEPYNDEDCDADKTLNASLDEYDIMEESYMNEEQSAVLPKVSISSFIFLDIFILLSNANKALKI